MYGKSSTENNHSIAYASLIGVFSISLLTLTHVIMLWVWVLCGCTIAIAFVRLSKDIPGIKNMTLNLLAIFCMLLLVSLANDFGLMATMVNLLIVAACLKLINMQTRGDYHSLLIIQFFLVACGLIYHQSIYMVAFYACCIVLLLCISFWLNKGSISISSGSKQSLKLIFQALPITALLFIVVPRLPPFWQAPVDKSAQTGLSETLTPGDIANLAKSDELVFRAEFKDKVPNHNQRYWRSIVLDYYDGKTWSISEFPTISNKVINTSGDTFEYLVMAEPNKTRWLYSLDIPEVNDNMGSQAIYINDQYQLFREDVSPSPSLYIVSSYYKAVLDRFVPQYDYAKYLQFPKDSNQQTQQWVADNIGNSMSFDDKLNTLNQLFTNNGFRYTLNPPLMLSDPIDQFLFKNKQGFCSHYASALTYMLRVANIPARMVAGYQGGTEENERILSIRQFDAHAWVEAYDKKRGWVRFDPTALVAPNRAMSGLMSALNQQESDFFNNEISSLLSADAFSGLRSTLAIIDFNWNTFVLGFNEDSQSSLITQIFGDFSYKSMIRFLLYALVTVAVFVALVFLPYHKLLRYKAPLPLHRVLHKLQKMGFVKTNSETLHTFSQRISAQLSTEANTYLATFIEHYYRSTYQHNNSDGFDKGTLLASAQPLLQLSKKQMLVK
ncbi:MAG: DUF3488 and transglutaminase-like domain-containing protein [Glaciecola sp.]